MLKKTITFTDYNGEKRTEDFYFNLNKAEISEMELEVSGGMQAMLQKIIAAQDTPTLVKIFKDLILRAYGEKSADGKYFLKKDKDGHKLADLFEQSDAYSELFMELASNAEAASDFINGIFPSDLVEKAKEIEAK
jgi:hypothetical protein